MPTRTKATTHGPTAGRATRMYRKEAPNIAARKSRMRRLRPVTSEPRPRRSSRWTAVTARMLDVGYVVRPGGPAGAADKKTPEGTADH